MRKKLIIATILTCSLGCFAAFAEVLSKINNLAIEDARSALIQESELPRIPFRPLNEVKDMLEKPGVMLRAEVINKILMTLKCAQERNVEHNNILTVIDYSLPSNEKRLWVFDLSENKLIFHTYVSHGIKSGTMFSKYFSNGPNSKASSIGVYNTEKTYRGRHGPSLKLNGLDKDFNDRAFSRFVVMHGAWYVDEDFIKKYGRAGRSWGCPAIPRNLVNPVIDTIKDKSLFVIYYPSNNWFLKSKFLNCDHNSLSVQAVKSPEIEIAHPAEENELGKGIIFVDLNNNNKREENEPIMVMTANDYERIFKTSPPLTRMLRRQINHMEYIALNGDELRTIGITNNKLLNVAGLNTIYFVIAQVRMSRGYYATEMKILNLGRVKEVTLNSNSSWQDSYVVHFERHAPVNIKSSNRFIRWLGL